MSRPARSTCRSDDTGSSLVDVAVTIGMMSLILGVLLVMMSTFMRNEAGVTRSISSSRDLQQAVNYFPFDVQSGPTTRTAYDTNGASASGCAGADNADSTNVVTFGVGDPGGGEPTRVAYRLTSADGTARLDRISCRPAGSTRTTVRIADGLAATSPTAAAARVEIVGDPVRSITLLLSRTDRPDAQLVASPQSDIGSAAPLTTTTAPATTIPVTSACPTNPFAVTRGFLAFTESSLRLAGGADSYGALATGGTFSWAGSPQISFTSPNTVFSFGDYGTQTAVYVGTTIDWAASSGALRIGNGGYVTVGDFSNGRYNNDIVNLNETRLEPAAGSSTLYLLSQSVSPQQTATNGVPVQRTSNPIDFAGAFATLRASSASFSALPGSCPGTTPLQLLGQNGIGTYSGNGPVWARFTPGAVNVFTTTVAELNAMTQWNHANGTSVPGQNETVLVVNITDEGSVTWNPPLGSQNYPEHVLFNFPNATAVQIDGVLWGSLLAPQAAVTTNNAQIRGNVIARAYTQNGEVLDWNRRFQGVLPW